MNSVIIRLVKRTIFLTITIFLITCIPLFSGKFEKYDFTFYETVSDSIAVMNEEKLGLDYTGYGFIGQSMTTGIYVRFGLQAPFTTIFSIFERDDKVNEEDSESELLPPSDSNQELQIPKELATPNPEDSPATDQEIKEKEEKQFMFSFTIGPAFRHFISESVMWYMGIGLTSTIRNTTTSDPATEAYVSNIMLRMGTDLDMGFRVDLAKKTSFRIGVNMTTDILTYTSTSTTGGKTEKNQTEQSLVANIFTPIGEKSSTDVTGYISLGHVIKPNEEKKYRYSNTTRKLGGGIKVEI